MGLSELEHLTRLFSFFLCLPRFSLLLSSTLTYDLGNVNPQRLLWIAPPSLGAAKLDLFRPCAWVEGWGLAQSRAAEQSQGIQQRQAP